MTYFESRDFNSHFFTLRSGLAAFEQSLLCLDFWSLPNYIEDFITCHYQFIGNDIEMCEELRNSIVIGKSMMQDVLEDTSGYSLGLDFCSLLI